MKKQSTLFLILVTLFMVLLLMEAFSQAAELETVAKKKKSFLVKVSLYDGSQIKGILGTLGDSSVQIVGRKTKYEFLKGLQAYPDSSQLNQTVNFNSIKSIEYRNIKATRTGALVGLIVGGLASFAVGKDTENCDPNSLSGPICEYGAEMDQLFTQVLIVGAGYTLGAVIGSIYKTREIAGKKENLKMFREEMANKQGK